MNDMKKPLDGIRVLDLSRVLAGPYCTSMLADLGAEVIKIEMPGHGDDSRHLGAFDANGDSIYYALINRGKRSVELDFKEPADMERFISLVKTTDVIVENFRPGVTKRLGIDFESLKFHNQKIVYTSISGFGQDGPFAKYPAYDIVAQAMSGLMSITGFKETGPTRVGESMGDIIAGIYASWAISSGLFARERTGEAQYIDVAMFDALLSLQVTGLASLFSGANPTLVGNRHPISTPFDTYKAKDGLVVIAIASDRLFQKFCESIGQAELASDDRFLTDETRTENETALKLIIETWAKQFSVDEVCEKLGNDGIPVSAVWNLKQAAYSEQSKFRQILVDVEGQDYPIVPQPVFFNGQKPHVNKPAPVLGEANDEIK